MVTLELATRLEPFDPKIETSVIGQRWKRWMRSFTYYVQARGLTDAEQKKALLLHLAGQDVQDIFETLPEAAGEEGEDVYDQTVNALNTYFQPHVNISYERHVFRQITQSETESIDQFATRLMQQASRCEFADDKEQIRDQIIDKCYSAQLRKALLEKKDITFDKVLEMGRAKEAAQRQAQAIGKQSMYMSNDSEVNAFSRKPDPHVKKQAKPGRKGKCFRCGREGHYAKDKECPARNEVCRKCQKIGHYQSQCKTKCGGSSGNGPQMHPRSRRVNAVETGSDQESESEFAFVVDDTNVRDGCIDVCVGGVLLSDVLIDSGATCNLIDKATWQSLKEQHVRCKSEKVTKKIYAYGSQKPLNTLGVFTACVEIDGYNTKAEFVVIDGSGRPILGRDTAVELNVLRVGREVNAVTEADFPGLFDGVGKLKGYEAKLHINTEVRPVAQNPRRVPYGLRDKVAAEIQNLQRQGIIEPVQGPTPWVNPVVIVPKPSGAVRLCVDMRQANEAIVRERHPIPTVDEVLQDLNGSTVLSKLDLRLGFHQLELHEDSRPITTFATHLGLFRYTRLFFGVNSAPELYQHVLRQVLRNCEGTANIADDIIVHGKTKDEHDKRLLKVFQTLSEAGLTLNREKCTFAMSQLEFMGHLISHRGVGPTKTRVEAVQKAREPQSASEVRSFLGLVNFSARYIPNMATVSEPLRRLTRQNVKFEWKSEQKQAFESLKNALTEAQTLAFFDKDAETQVIADAGPTGLGAVLIQVQHGERRVVCYASRSLSDVERRYSQTEKEALALVWSCERFHVYLCGIKFKLITDHKPLQVIFGPRSKPSARIERWVLRLQQYDYEVVYRCGASNIADPLSRLSVSAGSKQKQNVAEEYIRFVAEQSTPCVISIQHLEHESSRDPALQQIRRAIDTGNWSLCSPAVKAVKEEITKIGQLVLRGTRIIAPRSLQQKLILAAHEGHQGIVKTKARLRSKLWWPEMDKMTEAVCKSCFECQLVSQPANPEPMIRTELPGKAWEHLAADILGPLPDGQYVFVVVDYYSRYFEVRLMRTVTSKKLAECLDDIFTTHGLPLSLKTDNAQCFVSQEFTDFLSSRDIRHKTSIPLWPQSNGEVERQNRTLLKYLKIIHAKGEDMKSAMNKFLLAYRVTPHCTTGRSPAELLYNRKIRGTLPQFVPESEEVPTPSSAVVREQDKLKKEKGAEYGDKRRSAKPSDIREGDLVLLQQNKQNKLTTTYQPELYTVLSRNGSEVTVQSSQGVKYRRNVAHLKKFIRSSQDPGDIIDTKLESGPESDQSPAPADVGQPVIQPAAQPRDGEGDPTTSARHSDRVRVRPSYLQDFVTYVHGAE